MKGFDVKTTAALFVLIAMVLMGAATASAQNKRTNTLNDLHTYLNHQSGHRAELRQDRISLRDAGTGEELCTVMQPSLNNMTLSGEITKLNNPSARMLARVMQNLNYYNFNALVGTLVYDANTGRIHMEHYLNPQLLSTESIANVVSLFETSIRTESQRFSKLSSENLGVYMR